MPDTVHPLVPPGGRRPRRHRQELADRHRSAGRSAAELRLGVVTNDIYTDEDARFLRSEGVLDRRPDRGRRDRRLPAHRDPRRRHRQPDRRRDARGATSPRSTSCSSSPAATTSPRPSPRPWSTRRSSCSTSPAAATSPARAGPASPGPTCWSSTRPTWRRTSASTSRRWSPTPRRARGGRPVIALSRTDPELGRPLADWVRHSVRAHRAASTRPSTPARWRRMPTTTRIEVRATPARRARRAAASSATGCCRPAGCATQGPTRAGRAGRRRRPCCSPATTCASRCSSTARCSWRSSRPPAPSPTTCGAARRGGTSRRAARRARRCLAGPAVRRVGGADVRRETRLDAEDGCRRTLRETLVLGRAGEEGGVLRRGRGSTWRAGRCSSRSSIWTRGAGGLGDSARPPLPRHRHDRRRSGSRRGRRAAASRAAGRSADGSATSSAPVGPFAQVSMPATVVIIRARAGE